MYICIFSSFGMLTFHFVVEKLKFGLILVVNFCFCFCVFSLVSRKNNHQNQCGGVSYIFFENFYGINS